MNGLITKLDVKRSWMWWLFSFLSINHCTSSRSTQHLDIAFREIVVVIHTISTCPSESIEKFVAFLQIEVWKVYLSTCERRQGKGRAFYHPYLKQSAPSWRLCYTKDQFLIRYPWKVERLIFPGASPHWKRYLEESCERHVRQERLTWGLSTQWG